MRSVTQLKSLGDIRTTISTHARSTPRQRGRPISRYICSTWKDSDCKQSCSC